MATLLERPERWVETGQAGLYAIVDELRRRHQTPAAARTLDMVVKELGETRDNLRQALARLRLQPMPPGGGEILDELAELAALAEVDDLRIPLPPDELAATLEPLDGGQLGIAIILTACSLAVLGLSLLAVIAYRIP